MMTSSVISLVITFVVVKVTPTDSFAMAEGTKVTSVGRKVLASTTSSKYRVNCPAFRSIENPVTFGSLMSLTNCKGRELKDAESSRGLAMLSNTSVTKPLANRTKQSTCRVHSV